MKKILGILFIGLLWCNVGIAGEKEPGKDSKCLKIGMKEFNGEVKQNLNENEPLVFYVGCKDSASATWWWKGAGLDGNHKGAYKKCLGRAKERGIEDCYLFSIHDVVVWGKDASFVNKVEQQIYKKIASKVAQRKENNDKTPISPESISEWDYTCDKEDFKKYVATVEGCIALQHLGKIDKSKKKLVVFMHGDRKAKDDYKIKGWWTFSSVIKDEKKNINFFYLARPGHKFKGRSRSPGKYKNYEVLNKRVERVQFKKGWQANRLISQALYRLKEFYQPDKLIVIGFSGGANDIGVISGKVPGLIDIGIMGGCDCIMTKRPFWIPGEFIKTIDPKTELILISGEKDEYVALAKHYARVAKEQGLNVKMHVVKGGHQKETLLKHGKEIVKEALK